MHHPDTTAKVDHSTAGVQEAYHRGDIFSAFVISGHHGGLPNFGSNKVIEEGTLQARIRKTIEDDFRHWTEDDLEIPDKPCFPAWLLSLSADREEKAYTQSFYIRMLFSALVDADYLDTEAFMLGGSVVRPHTASMDLLYSRLVKWINEHHMLQPNTQLNEYRASILSRCLNGDKDQVGLFSLTVPTGGGKTISSLAYAISHAKANHQRRIIYVIPYTSIIEQNAHVFANILGEDNVIEHHSAIDIDDEGQSALRLATENWDGSLIVTTAVQFFESLYASTPAKCRKLHNLADSVIIFDEAQMLPLPYLTPCVAAIAELVKHYHTTAILCTATQPALDQIFSDYGCTIHELIEEREHLYEVFRRVTYKLENQFSPKQLAPVLAMNEQALCIVNRRATAREIYNLLPEEGRFCLTTFITPNDRRQILDVIRDRLKHGLICRVVSTSLIEAGVDIDFPTVWREEAGLDSIIQAGGRCNREGKNNAQSSIVHVFKGDAKLPQYISQPAAATKIICEQHAVIDDLSAVHDYFKTLLKFKGDAIDIHHIMNTCRLFNFKSAAEDFHLIETDTITIYIPDDENADMIEALRAGNIGRSLLRKLNQYAVQIYSYQYDCLLSTGCLEVVVENQAAILINKACYSSKLGLVIPDEMEVVFI